MQSRLAPRGDVAVNIHLGKSHKLAYLHAAISTPSALLSTSTGGSYGGRSWGAALALRYVFCHVDRADALLYMSGTGLAHTWHDAFRDERRRRLGDDFDRWLGLARRDRNAAEEREYRLLWWSIDFVDRPRSRELAGKLDRPFAINQEANRQTFPEISFS